jgi:hypothetical protein
LLCRAALGHWFFRARLASAYHRTRHGTDQSPDNRRSHGSAHQRARDRASQSALRRARRVRRILFLFIVGHLVLSFLRQLAVCGASSAKTYQALLNKRLNANPRLRWRFHPEFFDLRGFANDSEGSDAKTPAPTDVARAAATSSCDSAGMPG